MNTLVCVVAIKRGLPLTVVILLLTSTFLFLSEGMWFGLGCLCEELLFYTRASTFFSRA